MQQLYNYNGQPKTLPIESSMGEKLSMLRLLAGLSTCFFDPTFSIELLPKMCAAENQQFNSYFL